MVKPFVVKIPPSFFIWNLSANVGLNSPNQRDDVDLVQLGYACFAKTKRVNLAPAVRAAFAAVVPGAPCSGREGDLLVQAIRAHEVHRGGTQDGHVSVMPEGSGAYPTASGPVQFIILALNAQLHIHASDIYPRLDRFAGCPPTLKQVVATAMLANV